MKRALAVLSFAMLACMCAWSQVSTTPPDFFGGYHTRGSQAIFLATGANIPLFILPSEVQDTKAPLGVGVSFSIGYSYFVADRLSLGGSLTGSFNGTVGGRTLFLAPLSARLGYWFGSSPMEYQVALDLGMNVMRLSGHGMITPFAKLGGGAYRKITDAWGLGLQVFWWLVPELHFGSYADLTRFGNSLEVSVGATYHF